jgi:hypothetical protein
MDEYRQKGRLSTQSPSLMDKDISVFSDTPSSGLSQAMQDFFSHIQKESYISIQAYIPPTGETERALQAFRLILLDKYHIPTTLGFGPRFLHSTGQLHKGDAGKGQFIQITCDDAFDLAIPDETGSEHSSMTFGILKAAQAMGDGEALKAAGRRLMRLHISGPDITAAINRIAQEVR